MNTRSKRWTGPLLLVGALLPTLGVAVRAAADPDDDVPPPSPTEVRAHVLASIPRDPTVLINVTRRELPASPDILSLGKRSTRALERCLADNADAAIRAGCASLIGRVGDRSALPSLHTALQDWDEQVRLRVIEALSEIPDDSSTDPLLKLLRRDDESDTNRGRILTAFGRIGNRRTALVVRQELHRKVEPGTHDLRPLAFEALWRSRHLVARPLLISDVGFALTTDNTTLVYAAVHAASDLRSPRHVAPLTPLLQHGDANIRNKACHALGLIGDKSASPAILALLPNVRDARMLNNIAFALERLDRPAFFGEIRRLIEHRQAIIRLNATFVVGDVRRAEGLPLLEKALADPSDRVKEEAIVALGKLGTPAAAPPLERFVDEQKLGLREEAIYALHRLSGHKRTDLLHDKLFTLPPFRIPEKVRRGPVVDVEAIRRRAAIALGQEGDQRVAPYLLRCFDSGGCRPAELDRFLREARRPEVPGRVLLGWTKGRRDLGELVVVLRPAGVVPAAEAVLSLAVDGVAATGNGGDRATLRHAVDVVGDLGDAAARPYLERALTTRDPWLRVHAAVALARVGDPRGDAALLGDLDNFPAAWLPSLVAAAGRIHEPAAQKRLLPELEKRELGQDLQVMLAAGAVHLEWAPERALPYFLAALASSRVNERDLAERYLRRSRSPRVTQLLRAALAKEARPDTQERLRKLLDGRKG